ncbi:MAG: hypothetical protein PHD05_10140 [Sphaerochaetaceae bacterium]|nr:hypothetical protein [Sphaerochaetaceae bacterium]
MLGFNKSIEMPQQGDKFVQVFIEFTCPKDLKKSEITKIAEDVYNILYNTQSIFNENGEFVDCINPYLGFNLISSNGGVEGYPINPISKPFEPIFKKEKNGETKITFYPIKNKKEIDLYSLPRFHQDGYSIFNACKWIAEKYSIQDRTCGEAFLQTGFVGGQPTLEKTQGLLHLKYLVSERIKNAKVMPELDKIVFAEDIFTTIAKLKKDSKEVTLSKISKEWFEKVEELIEN